MSGVRWTSYNRYWTTVAIDCGAPEIAWHRRAKGREED